MRDTLAGLALIVGVLTLAACGGNTATETRSEASATLRAEDVIKAFSSAGMNIEDVEVLTAETDSNQLLGRPGQYTGKAFFYDARHPKSEIGDEAQNTVEVFGTSEDARARHDYIERMTSGVPMFAQYQLLRGKVLVRFDKAMLPAEVAEYEKVMKAGVPE